MDHDIELRLNLYAFLPGNEPGSFMTEKVIPNSIGINPDLHEPLGLQLTPYIRIIGIQQLGMEKDDINKILEKEDIFFAVTDENLELDLGRSPQELPLQNGANVHLLLNTRGFPSHIAIKLMSMALEKDAKKSVFIGHGRSLVWLKLKDFLQNRLNVKCEDFNTESPAGVATVDRLQKVMNSCSFAFLVLTAEDEHKDGSYHARENVVHEVGLFQGKLGFSKAIVLLEEDTKEFSNISGLGQIRFPESDISLAFEEIRRVLEREKVI